MSAYYLSKDPEKGIEMLCRMLDTIDGDKDSPSRITILSEYVHYADKDCSDALLRAGEHGTFKKCYQAKYRWNQVRHYFIRLRPIALVILEEWQRRVCAKDKSGRKRDLDKFCSDCSEMRFVLRV